jgi:hypothetical protein
MEKISRKSPFILYILTIAIPLPLWYTNLVSEREANRLSALNGLKKSKKGLDILPSL